VTSYCYDGCDQLAAIIYPDGNPVTEYAYDAAGNLIQTTEPGEAVYTYAYDAINRLTNKVDPLGVAITFRYDAKGNLTGSTDGEGNQTAYRYDPINRVTEIHRPNGVSTYNTYNARNQIVTLKNICDECEWMVSQYDYTYDDRGFIIGEDVVESLYGYAWDDKHEKDGEPNYQIIGTRRTFEYDDDGKLLKATEKEDRQGTYVYTFRYDDMGNRLAYSKTRNGSVQESAEYTYKRLQPDDPCQDLRRQEEYYHGL